MKPLRKLAGMTWPERVALVEASLLVAAFGVAVRVLPFERVRRVADRPTRPKPRWPTYALRAFPRAAGAAGRRFFPSHPCLPEALAVLWRTHGCGIPTELRIGFARSEAGKLEAHAWVDHEGDVLIGGSGAPDRYVPLERPEAGA